MVFIAFMYRKSILLDIIFYKDNLNNYNMNLKQFQKYYARAMFKSNNSIDINSVKKSFN